MNAPTQYPLPTMNFVGGSSETLSFRTYWHADKLPFDLSRCSANFAVINYVNQEGKPLFTKPMEVLTDEGTGELNLLRVKLSPVDTIYLRGKYIYQITIKENDNDIEPPQKGIIYISNNIDKDFALS